MGSEDICRYSSLLYCMSLQRSAYTWTAKLQQSYSDLRRAASKQRMALKRIAGSSAEQIEM